MNHVEDQLFSMKQVTVERGDRTVLRDLNLELPRAGPIVIAGPSGSGKSSLLRLLNRLDVPSTGSVHLLGEDLASLEPTALRRRVAMVFQRPVVLPGTVADNMREADASLDNVGITEALQAVGLDADLVDRPARDLSGGEAQRLCLARSLATNPEVVLFDEPTSSLDPAASARIEALAMGLEARAITVIWVTHDLAQLRRLARHVVVVIDGKIAQTGSADTVLEQPTAAVASFLAGDQHDQHTQHAQHDSQDGQPT